MQVALGLAAYYLLGAACFSWRWRKREDPAGWTPMGLERLIRRKADHNVEYEAMFLHPTRAAASIAIAWVAGITLWPFALAVLVWRRTPWGRKPTTKK